MLDLSDIKITQRDEQVLHLLVEGCSNKEIAEQLNISPRTVKQHLRTLFLRARIKDGRKRVKLRTTPRSTTNQAHRTGHRGPPTALVARIEHDSEHNFSSNTSVRTLRAPIKETNV
jgi:DNA-binding NarL/FixJ family response regulator